MRDDQCWTAVAERRRAADGAFVYAVRTTGIYCRPSCPSRRPERANVVFFPIPEAAERAGFRACRRCRPAAAAGDPQVDRVRRACRLIDEALAQDGRAPALGELAEALGASPFHLQRSFKRLVGLSPRAYADAGRAGRMKAMLRAGEPIAGALYDAGYGAPSRLYERADTAFGMTPATYAKGGVGAAIAFTTTASPLGRLLLAATRRGVCAVMLGEEDAGLEGKLRREFPAAAIRRDDAALAEPLAHVLAYVEGTQPDPALPLDIRATAFQWRVWQALRAIPRGETASYAEIARRLGRPDAARAVAGACAANPVALLIPCHRVVRGSGALGGYRWGLERKEALLQRERAARALSAVSAQPPALLEETPARRRAR